MLRLNLSREPVWYDLGYGVRLLCDPITTAVTYEVRNDPSVIALRPARTGDEDAPELDHLGQALLSLATAKATARAVVRDWEGIGDSDGNPAEITPEGLDALLDIQPMFVAFQLNVVAKASLLELEKNV